MRGFEERLGQDDLILDRQPFLSVGEHGLFRRPALTFKIML